MLCHSWCWQRWNSQSVFQSQPNLGREERRLPQNVSCLLAGEWMYEFVHEVYLRAGAGCIVLTCKLLQVCEWTCNQVQCVSVTWCLSRIWNCLHETLLGWFCVAVLCARMHSQQNHLSNCCALIWIHYHHPSINVNLSSLMTLRIRTELQFARSCKCLILLHIQLWLASCLCICLWAPYIIWLLTIIYLQNKEKLSHKY